MRNFAIRIFRLCGLFVPPGHFYSPIQSKNEIRQSEKIIWPAPMPMTLPGLNLHTENQIKLLDKFKPYFDNPAYSYSDAIFLHCIMREFKPRKIIEIGAGFSSCVMMDYK